MRFLDADIFLFARLDQGARGERARTLLRRLSSVNRDATTAVVLNEVLWNLRKAIGREAALTSSRVLTATAGLNILNVGEREWNLALQLMSDHDHLKPNDAMHAATALEAGIDTIVSTDDDFDGLPGLRRVDLA